MLLSNLLNEKLENISTNEALCSMSCPVCRARQTLAAVTTDQSDDLETIYICQEGCSRVLTVSARTEPDAPLEKGYRIGLWMIRNPRDLFVLPSQTAQKGIRLPACKDALVE